ncbi:F0F1 ATP synthase subunit B, partial [Arthrobacter sp.]
MDNAVILAAESPLAPNLWELLVTVAGFAVLMYIVIKFVMPAFEKTFAERTEAIEGGIAKAEAAQAEANAAREEYKQQLLDARTEANRIREEARAEGAQILAELKEKAVVEATRISAQAEAQIEADRQAAV